MSKTGFESAKKADASAKKFPLHEKCQLTLSFDSF